MRTFFMTPFLFIAFAAMARLSATGLDEVISAIRTGNATEIGKNLDDHISLSLPDKAGAFSKVQATDILQEFFSANTVKSLDIQFKGEKGGNQFCVGRLQTTAGVYRITVFMKDKGGQQVVKEIRFGKE
jgi:hypothetical protein